MSARAVLRISSPDLDPDHVTRATGLAPTHVQRRGEPQRFAKDLVHTEGSWRLESKLPEVLELRAHVESIVEPLHAAGDALAALRATGADVVLECTVVVLDQHQRERVVLDHALVARLAALSIDVHLHLSVE